MRHFFAIGGGGAAPILMLAFLMVVACNSSKTAQDADTVTPDGDTSIIENDVITADDALAVEDDSMLAEDSVLPDADNSLCPDLKVYENVKAAGFPFKDTNGKITFCRPGCDTPTENDPQCARNLWEWINWTRYQNYKTGQRQHKECYPWPCELPDEKASSILYSECDKDLSHGSYVAGIPVLYDLRLQDNKIGIFLSLPDALYATKYDIVKDVFTTVAPVSYTLGYNHSRFIFYTTTEDYIAAGTEKGNTYVMSAKENTTGYRYEVIYDDDQHQAEFSRPPLVGNKWVVLNVNHRATGAMEVLYSKVDEWKWHPFKFSKVYEGNIVDNRLTFINDNLEVYVCDLDKLPYDPSKECIRIDRTGETPSQPRLNEENKNQLVYISGTGEYGMTLVDISGTTPAYSLLPVTPSDPQVTGIGSEQFKGNFVLYTEAFMPVNSSRQDYKTCFYRIDTKKQYCPVTASFQDGRYDMGFNSFDGNYQLWKAPASINARFRDISCYCEKEGVCPFEGMK